MPRRATAWLLSITAKWSVPDRISPAHERRPSRIGLPAEPSRSTRSAAFGRYDANADLMPVDQYESGRIAEPATSDAGLRSFSSRRAQHLPAAWPCTEMVSVIGSLVRYQACASADLRSSRVVGCRTPVGWSRQVSTTYGDNWYRGLFMPPGEMSPAPRTASPSMPRIRSTDPAISTRG